MGKNNNRDRTERIFALAARVGVWAMFFVLLFVLRSFFLLILLTFVFSYIQVNAVNRLGSVISNRTTRVVLVFSLLLAILIGVGAFIVPQVKSQAAVFVQKLPGYLYTLDKKILTLKEQYPIIADYIPARNEPWFTVGEREPSLDHSVTVELIQNIFGVAPSGDNVHSVVHGLGVLREFGAGLLAVGSAFLLSLLFSLLIMIDLPGLTTNVRKLRQSRLQFIYEEVSENIYNFSRVLGRALEAQLFIALLNTILTAIGLLFLGQGDKIAFLSLIVFICSFIPVAGVFISSIPICLIELQDAGIMGLFLAIGLITVIHLIEAYILNPKIYGHHMRINPVLVLMILTVGGKLFGFWGLLLGVPICTYLFGHAIWPRAAAVDSRNDLST